MAIGDDKQPEHYGHLQMHLIALYLIAIVQMTAGGAQVRVHSIIRSISLDYLYTQRSMFHTKSRLLHRTNVSNTRLWHVGTRNAI